MEREMTRAEKNEQIAQGLYQRIKDRPHPVQAARIAAMKCCAHVHPSGTSKWRYCNNDAVARDPETGLVYCERHIGQA